MSEHFLDLDQISEHCAYAGVDASDQVALLALAARISSQPNLLALAQALHHNTYAATEWAEEDPPTPVLEAALGADADALYVLVGLDCVGMIRAAQAKRGVPEAITQASCDSAAVGLRRFRKAFNRVGLDRWTLGWFHYLAGGSLYRLGRLHFISRPCEANVTVYRHKTTGQVQALALAGRWFGDDGFDLPGGAAGTMDSWLSERHEDANQVTGTPISPHGMAVRQPITLALNEWTCVLGNGDPILELHIPDLDSITLDVLGNSFALALEFFPRYYPDVPYKAFVCESWMFNTQLQAMLPMGSRLVQFQRQGYLVPQPPSPEYMLYFIFGRKQINLTTAPRDTTLRRAVLAQLETGGTLRNGGWFLLKDDASQFGQEPYLD